MKTFIKYLVGFGFIVGIVLIIFFVFFQPVKAASVLDVCHKKVDYFTLMVDQSGSMFLKDNALKERKMLLAKEAVTNVFAAVPEEFSFDSSLKTACDYKEVYNGKFTKDSVASFLKTDVPDNGSVFGRMTPLSKSLIKENETLTDAKSAVILVTDGEYNLGKTPVQQVKNIYEQHPNTTVHVISFADTEKGEQTVKEICSLKSGSQCVAGADLAKYPEKAKKFAKEVFLTCDEFVNDIEIYFDLDKSNIKPEEAAKLDKLKDNQTKIKKVIGWADISGTREYNMGLSKRRAKAVADYLGIEEFVGKGVSEKYPQRKFNRRVDVIQAE